MGISDRHIPVPYLWIRPISAWIRFGVKNQKKVDDAVVFGLRGMHNHTHLGYVIDYVTFWGRFYGMGRFLGYLRSGGLLPNSATTYTAIPTLVSC